MGKKGLQKCLDLSSLLSSRWLDSVMQWVVGGFDVKHAKQCFAIVVRLSSLDDLTAQRNATNCIETIRRGNLTVYMVV